MNFEKNRKYYRCGFNYCFKRINNEIILRKFCDKIPPHLEYSLSKKGNSIISILQNKSFYKKDNNYKMLYCQKCDYNELRKL